jgi:heptosyltransferase-2
VNKILFIQTAFIGDAILSLPAIQKLKLKYPDYEINVLCIPKSKEIFDASDYVSKTIVLDKRGKHRSLFETIRLGIELKKANYSIIYSSHRSFRTAIIVLFARVKNTFGFKTSSLKFVYKNLVEYKTEKHEIQRNLDLIGFDYENDNWRIVPELIVKKKTREKISTFLTKNYIKNNFIAIAPGSVWETKKYPKEYLEMVINYFVKKGFQILLIGGDKDKLLCSSISEKYPQNVFDASGLFSIIESVELLKLSSMLLSNDSAPTHFGMCANIKVLTVYCSTVPEFGFFPYNKKSRYLSFNELECKPCGIHGHHKCPINTFDCGKKLLPEQLIKTMEEMLSD